MNSFSGFFHRNLGTIDMIIGSVALDYSVSEKKVFPAVAAVIDSNWYYAVEILYKNRPDGGWPSFGSHLGFNLDDSFNKMLSKFIRSKICGFTRQLCFFPA